MDMPAWLLDPTVLTVVAVLAFTAAIIIFPAYWFWGRHHPPDHYEPEVVAEWRSTGQIDFISADEVMRSTDEDKPAQFTMLMQEQRQVANIAGAPATELRWRWATKAEVKDIVRRIAVERARTPSGVFSQAPTAIGGLNVNPPEGKARL